MTEEVATEPGISWVQLVRECKSIPELNALWEELGGADNGDMFRDVFRWRKEELVNPGVGIHLTQFSGGIEQVFRDWEGHNQEMRAHAEQWANADAKVKRLQGRKFTQAKAAGLSDKAAEAVMNEDQEVFDSRLARNIGEGLLKADYSMRDLLAARWEYLRSLMSSERAATEEKGLQR